MKDIEDKSINAIICDLPYGTTANKFDSVIDLNKLWEQYERIITDKGAIVLFGSQPFTTDLIMSNRKLFKYQLIWKKNKSTNFLNAKCQPLKIHEEIVVFSKSAASYSKKGSMTYNPQMTEGKPYTSVTGDSRFRFHSMPTGYKHENKGTRCPQSILEFPVESGYHPTQKPQELYKYLISTYSNEGDLILDNACGSGTIGIAQTIGRNYIGIEKDENYYNIACERVKNNYMTSN